MASNVEVLAFLRPNGGYVQVGEEYEGIDFIECEPFTKKQYEDAFALVDAKVEQDAKDAAAKRDAALAKLAVLGLDIDDLKALGLA